MNWRIVESRRGMAEGRDARIQTGPFEIEVESHGEWRVSTRSMMSGVGAHSMDGTEADLASGQEAAGRALRGLMLKVLTGRELIESLWVGVSVLGLPARAPTAEDRISYLPGNERMRDYYCVADHKGWEWIEQRFRDVAGTTHYWTILNLHRALVQECELAAEFGLAGLEQTQRWYAAEEEMPPGPRQRIVDLMLPDGYEDFGWAHREIRMEATT